MTSITRNHPLRRQKRSNFKIDGTLFFLNKAYNYPLFKQFVPCICTENLCRQHATWLLLVIRHIRTSTVMAGLTPALRMNSTKEIRDWSRTDRTRLRKNVYQIRRGRTCEKWRDNCRVNDGKLQLNKRDFLIGCIYMVTARCCRVYNEPRCYKYLPGI